MEYMVLGKTITINSMQKPEGVHGSLFELEGEADLEEVGLPQKFWFRAPNLFADQLPVDQDKEMYEANTDELMVLSKFLHNNIAHQKLADQFTAALPGFEVW